MTSGGMPMRPGVDTIYEALRRAIRDDPQLRERKAEEVSKSSCAAATSTTSPPSPWWQGSRVPNLRGRGPPLPMSEKRRLSGLVLATWIIPRWGDSTSRTSEKLDPRQFDEQRGTEAGYEKAVPGTLHPNGNPNRRGRRGGEDSSG